MNKRLTIYSRDGAGVTIVGAADLYDRIFDIIVDHVNINGFTVAGVRGANVFETAPVYLHHVEYCNISNNRFSPGPNYQTCGIFLDHSSNNTVSKNTISGFEGDGIRSEGSNYNDISNNIITGNGFNAIWAMYSDYNNINENTCSNNGRGIEFKASANNNIMKNTCSNNGIVGISIWVCSGINYIENNICNSNGNRGIYLDGSHNQRITKNICTNNDKGILLSWGSSKNIITKNTCSNNDYGIWLGSLSASNNVLYLNNFINNNQNVYSTESSTNTWNSTSKITYIYNSSTYINYLGNYWSDYTGSDADRDGIGDIPYNIDSDKDYYPLMKWFENYTLIPDTTPPTVTFVPPTPANNSEVTVNYVFVNVTLNENGNTALLNWNGTNETMLGSNMNFYLNKAGLSNGIYTYRVYANDTSDNWNVSDARVVTVNVPASTTDIESSSETGVRKDLFNAEESVFASGSNYAINKDYNISVVADQTWTDGMDIPNRAAGTANKVFTDKSGDIAYSDLEGAGTPPALIWSAAVDDGTYDIVIDVNEKALW